MFRSISRGGRERPDLAPGPDGSSRAGFTLIEMMVGIVVVGLVLVAAFTTAHRGIRMMETARDYTRVAQILQSEIEDLRTLNWSDLEAMTTSNFTQVDLSDDFESAYGNRYRVWRWVRDRTSDQKEISVWVWWQDGDKNWRNKITTTWFTENGMCDYYYRSF